MTYTRFKTSLEREATNTALSISQIRNMEEETTTLLTIMPEISRAYSNMTDFMELSGMGKFVVEGVRMGQEFNVNAVPIAMVVRQVSSCPVVLVLSIFRR